MDVPLVLVVIFKPQTVSFGGVVWGAIHGVIEITKPGGHAGQER